MATALITGASAGLGLELAKLFATDKHDLVLVARRRDRLDQLAAELGKAHGVKTLVIAADLQEAGAVKQIADEVAKAGVEIEFLVNNAGFGTAGAFTGLPLDKELGQIAVNISALVALTHAFLPGMVKRGHGRVLNLGSSAGFQAGPYMATYYATKAFVNSFSEALWQEVKGTGVTVTVSCPGATSTEFGAVAGNDKSALFTTSKPATAHDVALDAYRGMHAGRVFTLPGLKTKFLVWVSQMSPRFVLRPMIASLNKIEGGKSLNG